MTSFLSPKFQILILELITLVIYSRRDSRPFLWKITIIWHTIEQMKQNHSERKKKMDLMSNEWTTKLLLSDPIPKKYFSCFKPYCWGFGPWGLGLLITDNPKSKLVLNINKMSKSGRSSKKSCSRAIQCIHISRHIYIIHYTRAAKFDDAVFLKSTK